MKAKKTKKGFTLMELIIVLVIMGILVAIIVPSWSYFVRRSRERTANSKAKMVFNACQTEVTRVSMKERPLINIINDPTVSDTKKNEVKADIYMGDGKFYFYWDGKTGTRLDPVDIKNTKPSPANDTSLKNGINNINNNGEGVYKIYVDNYQVKSVVYSDMPNGRYKGTYPRMMDDLDDTTRDYIRSHSMDNYDSILMGNLS
ncbi:type IV pilin protein [Ruminococcus flavefaciens]|uniref:type IV pilin protein n=1 Tax=Ruminococcus flavefaciens TaxID=1265 RepID=UPI00055C5566|nr:type II secretion system protein [Ruminococcus flavefaciens]